MEVFKIISGGQTGADKGGLIAAKKANIKSGFHLVEPAKEELTKLVDFGYDMVAFSVDIRMLDSSARIPFK